LFVCLLNIGTGPSLTTQKEITIVLLDINDSPPILDSYPTPITVKENNENNVRIIQFHARDLDAPNTSNSLVTYSLVPSNHSRLFHLDAYTGILSVAKNISFDYESQTKYELILNLTDHGTHPKRLETLHSFTVYINDTNDNEPQFEQDSYHFQVAENIPVGTMIGQVKAIDRDVNSTITYELTCIDDENLFEINPFNGQLRTKSLLDYELHSTYHLNLIAKDNDNLHSVRVNITIDLIDINDNPPSIESQPTAIYIPSEFIQINQTKTIVVTTIIARDLDAGMNGNLTYAIIDGNQNDFFQIHRHNGTIFGLTSNLPQGHHRVTVKVCDQGKPISKCSTTIVNIKIGEYVDKLFYTASINSNDEPKNLVKKDLIIEQETIFTREMILVVLISTILTLIFSITMGILIACFCKQKRCRHLHHSSLKTPCELLQSTDADKLLTTTTKVSFCFYSSKNFIEKGHI